MLCRRDLREVRRQQLRRDGTGEGGRARIHRVAARIPVSKKRLQGRIFNTCFYIAHTHDQQSSEIKKSGDISFSEFQQWPFALKTSNVVVKQVMRYKDTPE